MEVGLISSNAAIDMLVIRLFVGNKRLQGDLSKIIEVHEEYSFIDSDLRKEGRRVFSNNKHWKEGYVDEIESKFKSIEIEC